MNLFNRIAMCLILLVFIAGTLLVALLPREMIEALRYTLDVAEYNLTPASRLAGAVLGLLVAAGAGLLLFFELRPPSRQAVVVAHGTGATAELTNESVALRIKRVAEAISGVREATPVIHSRGRTVDVVLRLMTDPDVDIPAKSQEVIDAVRAEADGKMGVPVSSLRVTVRHGPQGARGSGPAPLPPPGSNLGR